MRSSQPPIVATWVLTRFGNGNEVLAGDLVEEYQRGRTAAWYWRQVLGARPKIDFLKANPSRQAPI
jgi:hypothetical protein